MAHNLVYAIILFIFLFLVANNVQGNVFFPILFKFHSLVCSSYIVFISFL